MFVNTIKRNVFIPAATFSQNVQLVEAIDIRVGNALFSDTKGGEQMQAYCVKCRTKREMRDAKSITMKNGKPATQGVCPTCGTKMFRIGKG